MSEFCQGRPRVEFLGITFDRLEEAAAIEKVFELANAQWFSAVVTPNVDHVVALSSSDIPEIADAYDKAAMCLCDSRILALLARWSGVVLSVVPGSDLTARLIEHPRLAGQRVAVIGATAKALDWLREKRPDASFVQWIPPLGVRDDLRAQAAIIKFVENANATLVLFAIGAPQSELLAQELARRGHARGVGLCIGASIDFMTGEKRRAPRAIQRARLEWAHRLISEPARLWRRYLVRGPRIFAIWLRWHNSRET